VRSWIDAFDDFRIEPREVIELEPFLLAVVHQSGRGRASGAPIEIEIAHLWTIEDGRAIRLESHRTRQAALDAMRQP
jgi:ketosteroid isomerase-like protein